MSGIDKEIVSEAMWTHFHLIFETDENGNTEAPIDSKELEFSRALQKISYSALETTGNAVSNILEAIDALMEMSYEELTITEIQECFHGLQEECNENDRPIKQLHEQILDYLKNKALEAAENYLKHKNKPSLDNEETEISKLCKKMWERYDVIFKHNPKGRTVNSRISIDPLKKGNQLILEFKIAQDLFTYHPEQLGYPEGTAAYERELLLSTSFNAFISIRTHFWLKLSKLEETLKKTSHLNMSDLEKISRDFKYTAPLKAPETHHITSSIMQFFLDQMRNDFIALEFNDHSPEENPEP
jgi:hypothetical protein